MGGDTTAHEDHETGTGTVDYAALDMAMTEYNEGLQSHPMHPHQFPMLVFARDGIPLDHPYFADTLSVAPGERFSVLMHMDDPGTWVFHCHILNHVERDTGMFGMVTAFVVEEAGE